MRPAATEGEVEDPSHVRPPHAALHGRVNIARAIGVAMMIAMVGNPAQWPELERRRAEECEQKLNRTVRLKRAMGEQTMKADGDAKAPRQRQTGHKQPRGG